MSQLYRVTILATILTIVILLLTLAVGFYVIPWFVQMQQVDDDDTFSIEMSLKFNPCDYQTEKELDTFLYTDYRLEEEKPQLMKHKSYQVGLVDIIPDRNMLSRRDAACIGFTALKKFSDSTTVTSTNRWTGGGYDSEIRRANVYVDDVRYPDLYIWRIEIGSFIADIDAYSGEVLDTRVELIADFS